MNAAGTFRDWLATIAFAFWFGGFTLYAGVVIPVAHEVLGSHLEVGFITRQVTQWLNWASLPALALLLWRFLATSAGEATRARRALAISWGMMALAQLALFVLHTRLDAKLDADAQSIVHRAGFYGTHRIYLLVSAAQWLAGLVHTWFWTRGAPASSSPA